MPLGQRGQRGHRPQRAARAPCASARAVATPIRRPVKVPGPDADRDRRPGPPKPTPARSITAATAGISSRACAGGRGQPLRRGARLEGLAVGAQHAGGASRRWRCRSRAASLDRDPCAGRRPRARAARARATRSSAGSATPGHSTNAIRSGRQVVVEQRRVLAGERLEPVEVEVGDLGRAAAVAWPIVKVGLVTGPSTPSARHAPRTNVVLPLPSSPLTSTTSPGGGGPPARRRRPRSRPGPSCV